LYYLLAGKITNVQRSYRHWLAMACWTGLPQVLAVLPAIGVLLASGTTQLDSSAIQPLSLNALFMHRDMGDAGYQLFTSINLLHLLTLPLAVMAIRVWSGRSWLFSSVYALLPVVLIFGGWAVFALGRA
jgi:hypothetical protein